MTNRFDETLDGVPYLSSGRILNVLSLFLGLLVWQSASQVFGMVLIAPPTKVATTLYDLLVSMELPLAIIGSLQTLLVGYLIAVAIAIPLGFLLAQSKYALWAIDPYVDAIYTAPPIVYLPLVVVWFGLGFEARVFFVVIFSFFEILINTYEGIRTTKEDYLLVSRSFDASWWQTQSKVILPASVPFIFAGLRIGMGRAVRGVIVAELFLRLVNIGRLLQASNAVINTSVQFAIIIAVAVMGIVLQRAVLETQRLIAPWSTTEESH